MGLFWTLELAKNWHFKRASAGNLSQTPHFEEKKWLKNFEIINQSRIHMTNAETDQQLSKLLQKTDGLDPYEIPASIKEAVTTIGWQDYWGDEDPDDPTNCQSEYSEDPSDSDEDPD
ncbi:hypothetical protein RclHR1_12720003 [Rhizophagus clarus]|uniref:Uncharacterized protein n=1 Tax=Rhizophagus clarus TaxID=94130 RepID=A0A2Z6R0X4_9GLOM|nr:hypothetical protein RclHR1_12720003 [Rhizophagus clarus]